MDKESLLKKVKVAILFLLPLVIISLSFFSGKVFAADAVPAPGRIPCTTGNEKDPEFSSDRPYQGSPCGDRPITYWCGNDVVINLGTVKIPYCDKQSGQLTECPCNDPGKCDHTGNNYQSILVDLTDVQLPILGNTQLTKNSVSADDQIDDGTKTSNYVAWYLGGTNGKAEYGAEADPNTIEGISKIVDTSGPIKKLLPSVIQDAQRLTVIDSATKDVTYLPDTDGASTPQPTTEPENHNQIVVCADHDGSGIWAGIQDILGLGKYNPIDCYSGGGSAAKGDLKMRLKDWNSALGANVVINAAITTAIEAIRVALPFVPAGAIETSIGNHWPLAKPPLPWADQSGKPFKTDVEYRKAYSEWRGNICAIIPIVNQVVCFSNIFVPTKYADLYQYIPLANTVDKKGSHMVTNTHIDAPKATLTDVAYQIIHSPQLYLSHSLENYQLSTELKSTFVSKDSAGATVPNDVENNSQCRIIPSRTNSGDDATFNNPKSQIEVNVEYKIDTIQCSDIHEVCDFINYTQKYNCHWEADCSTDVYATVNTIGKFAYNDEIWSNTVAGSDSIFRRIYPKTGAGSPVSCIADTPAVSNATYTLDNSSAHSSGLELLRIIEPDKSAVKSEDGITANAQLYYPHYGGVLDYFLNGIQQALRPQGYGPGQPTDGQYCTNLTCGELPNLPKGSGACSLNSTKGLNVPGSLKSILEAAGQTYNTPPGLILGIMYGEGLFEGGRLNWTDQNVKNWATCVKVPGCNETGDDNFMGFNGSDFQNIVPHILPDIQKLDPTRKTLSQCNLLDAIYAEAWNLHDSADGGGGIPATCFGVTLGGAIPSSCSWNNSQYAAAIKIAENGYDNGCFTLYNSCATGGGNNALCNNGIDGCETITNRYPGAPSHFGCVWDVAH